MVEVRRFPLCPLGRETGRPACDVVDLAEAGGGSVTGDIAAHAAGLTTEEVERRLAEIGRNELPSAAPVPWWRRVLGQLRSSIIYILLFALAFDLAVWVLEGAGAWPFEALAIATILVFNTGMGVWQEHRAEDALARLRELSTPKVDVLRDGRLERVDAVLLVPGDLVRLEAGDRVPADGLVTDEHALAVDESVLTGESVPVEHAVDDEVLAGTLVVRGVGWAELTRTGVSSAMGQIAGMLQTVTAQRTPLERRMEHFGHRVARWIAALAVLLTVAGVGVEGVDRFDEALLFAVAVAVAAVPEGLPAVLTLTLALGTERMSKRRAVVRRLSAVEALGSVTVIATDKTGTLTENSMTVQRVDSPDPARALRAMVIAADAEPDGGVGDPMELGLYAYAADEGLDPMATRRETERISVQPFDSAWRYMRVTVEEDGQPVAYLKGAAEALMAKCDLPEGEHRTWQERIDRAAAEGLRTLALAWSPDDGEERLRWLGFVSLRDPPRAEVPAAVDDVHDAGIRVLMITGDHPTTAGAIAQEVGIPGRRVVTGDQLDSMSPDEVRRVVADTHVFARVRPEHKLALVNVLRDQGEIVAMTGDGVNDAPALKQADIGIAMGIRGSDVSREVADLVLLDDNFATIAAAVDEGRGIYDNIQKFIRFLFSTNVALVLLVAIGVVGAAALGTRDDAGDLLVPLTAAQLLWINVIADGPPALALGFDRNRGMLQRPPRSPVAPLLTRPCLRFIVTTGVAKATLGLALFFSLPHLGYSGTETRTAVFLYESLAQLSFVYPARVIVQRPSRNRLLDAIVAASVAVQLAAVSVPALRTVLGLEALDGRALALVASGLAASVGVALASARTTSELPADVSV